MRLPLHVLALAGLLLAAACHGGKPKTTSQPPPPPPEMYPGDETRCPVMKPASTDCPASSDPGHVTLRRLNRTEYNNSVHDLLGDTTQPANDFPEDGVANGFDTNGDLLSVSTLYLDNALLAAQKLVDTAWTAETQPAVPGQQFSDIMPANGGTDTEMGIHLPPGAELDTTFTLPGDATVIATLIMTAGDGSMAAGFDVLFDGQSAVVPSVQWSAAAPTTFTVNAPGVLHAGKHTFVVRAKSDDPSRWVNVQGGVYSYRPVAVPFEQAHLRVCDIDQGGDACIQQILKTVGRRAWRRPLSTDELTALLALAHGEPSQPSWSEAERVEQGVRDALVSLFASPNFLFRVEVDPDATSCAPHPLEDHELATRLSYSLWSTTPDEHLLALADACTLHEPDVYAGEIERLLQAPQAIAFVRNFGGQWLQTRKLASVQPDPTLFPQFDQALREAMQAETEQLFTAFLNEDRAFPDIIDADFTFLNDRLAQHYGLMPPGSMTLVRTPLPSGTLGGLLSRAGVLTVNSYPTRTSPTRRGSWVLGTLLCAQPPPPPANVPPLPDTGMSGGKTMKERLASHRADPVCAACHTTMDTIGLGFENYDAIGEWRTTDQGETIDPSGVLPDGQAFQTPADLAKIVKNDSRLNACLTQKLFTYTLGRSPTNQDSVAISALNMQFQQDGARLRALVKRMLTSPAFTTRRGDTVATP